jgi:hypothetical protein
MYIRTYTCMFVCVCVHYVVGRWGSEGYKLGRQASEEVQEEQEEGEGGVGGGEHGSGWARRAARGRRAS